MKLLNKGKVILAGAGPGDPELISLKALKYLQTAEVILTDRLVSPELIEEYASKEATVIYVGKQCSKGIHTPQEDINELMVEFALLGKLVLRLKGGDSMLFSNILDELQVLKANKIAYEIIPGISAAFGAASYTGIPLTAREHSRGVRFLTLYDLKTVAPSQWNDWATTSDTLVFYMSGQRLEALTQTLLENGISTSKGLAVVQQATTPNQKTRVFSFEELKTQALPEFEYVPTLIIIGKVVNLHQEFAWVNENATVASYFDNHKTIFQNAI
ncbi:uroporphyrinogen-III C-methyltransferase [Flavobacterium sp. SM15]|uniref:uroporphyrinogen-III C-methyltransferase n=1 Tax=Flavobacterium sp. SM15 TaxID=2908005 RepID=UPI001EDBCE4E|nr:uroporphyrinogen-III C-methyltransferase [Flavobacterium sp. SM15]MCG2612358.1 uroporphyrinogen-III C-methyltransferase [Flavobacterium sp. SM15]